MFKNWKLILKFIVAFFCASILITGTINQKILTDLLPTIANSSPEELTFADLKVFLDKIEIISLGILNIFGFLMALALTFKLISLIRERNKKSPTGPI